MLTIEENEAVNLPRKHHKIHNICAVIYDQLTEIIGGQDESYAGLLKTNVTISPDHKYLNEMHNEEMHILEWMAENQLNNELTTTLVKHIVNGLIFDFTSFVYESLSNAKKGKLTVAYALLRKPFTDVLLLLEQIFYDKNEFITRFYHNGDPDSYDPGKPNLDKLSIIINATKKLNASAMYDPQFIYDVRYEKSCDYGLNGISNKAIHIVTSQRYYKTENQSLNFSFLSKEDMDWLWNHYYTIIPYLLNYFAAIVDQIVFEYLPDAEKLREMKAIKRFIAMTACARYMAKKNLKSSDKMLKVIYDNLKHTCVTCNNKINIQFADLELFFHTDLILCDKCFSDQLLDTEFEGKFINLWIAEMGL